MATLADLLVRIGVDTDDLEGGMASAAEAVDRNFAKITAAGAIAGAGLETFARRQAPATENARKLAASTGIAEGAMRDLIRETSNVTFPLDEVIGTMEAARQQGLTSADDLQEFANFWDTVGDATGENAVQLADAGVALRAVGIAAGDESGALDAFGFITEETTGSVTDFLTFLERTGPELNEMGAGVDEAAAIMGALEGELGMTARTARTEFRKAVNEADGDMSKMLDTLGISEETFNEYAGAVSGSAEVIERNAAIHADSFTPMQKLQHGAEELMFRFGGLGDAAGMLAMPLMALGPLAKVVTGTMKLASGAFMAVGKSALVAVKAIGSKVVAWTIMGAKSLLAAAKVAAAWLIAMGPIALVIAAVVGLVVLIVKNWDKIVEVTRKAWDWIVGKFRQATDWVSDMWSRMWSAVTGAANRAIAFVKSIPGRILNGLRALATSVLQFVTRYHPVAVLFRAVRAGLPALIGFVKGIPRRIVSGLGNLGRLLFNAGKDILKGLVDGIRKMARAPVDAVKGVVENVRKFLPFSPAKEGPLSGRGAPNFAGSALVEMLADGMSAEVSALARQADAVARAAMPELDTVRFGTTGVPELSGVARTAGGGGGGPMHIEVPLTLDGREIARGTATFTREEIRRLEMEQT